MIFDPILDLFRGKTITIPPLDGPFRANNTLEEAALFARLSSVDNLAVLNDRIIASSGDTLYAFDENGKAKMLQSYAANITALAVSPGNEWAVGLDTGELLIAGHQADLPPSVKCITALAFAQDGSLWMANGSTHHPPSAWVADLMEKMVGMYPPVEIRNLLEKSLQYDSADRQTWMRIVKLRQEQPAEQYRQINRMLERFPDDKEVLLLGVEAALKRNAFKKASKLATAVLELDPIDATVRQLLIKAHLGHAAKLARQQKYELAVKQCKLAQSFDRTNTGQGSIEIFQ
ncbi:MAG: hypothetical protein DSY89_07120, partial [Deltaproteobacteria bacterium]